MCLQSQKILLSGPSQKIFVEPQIKVFFLCYITTGFKMLRVHFANDIQEKYNDI